MRVQSFARRMPWLIGIVVVVLCAVAAVLAFRVNQEPPMTWEEAFNHQHGTAVLVDASDDQPQHLFRLDFEPEGAVNSYTGNVCWGPADNPHMQLDEWAVFSDEVRKHGNGIKLEVVDTGEKGEDGPLKAVQMTILPYRPLTPEDAQLAALKVARQLWDHGPCKKN